MRAFCQSRDRVQTIADGIWCSFDCMKNQWGFVKAVFWGRNRNRCEICWTPSTLLDAFMPPELPESIKSITLEVAVPKTIGPMNHQNPPKPEPFGHWALWSQNWRKNPSKLHVLWQQHNLLLHLAFWRPFISCFGCFKNLPPPYFLQKGTSNRVLVAMWPSQITGEWHENCKTDKPSRPLCTEKIHLPG